MPQVRLDDLGEHAVVRRVVDALRSTSTADVLIGPGDDAALLAAPDARVVVTTDVLVDGRHWRDDWSRPEHVGEKAVLQSCADVMASGARTTGLVVGLVAPGGTEVDWVDGLARGMARAAASAGASVVGGDVTAGEQRVVAVTALGDLGGRPPLRRDAARPGQVVLLVGRTGLSAAGLAVLQAGLDERDHPEVVDVHRVPRPPLAAGPVLAGLATAGVDTSDGLASDVGHVARASGVVVEVDVADVPVAREVLAAARALSPDDDGARRLALRWVLTGGEDHALVVTCDDDVADRAVGLLAEARLPQVARVGRVVVREPDRDAGVRFVGLDDLDAVGTPGHEHWRVGGQERAD